MFSADVVAALLYCTGTTSLSIKNYEMMNSLDKDKTANAYQHDFRSVFAKAKELKARVEGGEEFEPVTPSSKRGPKTPASTNKRRKTIPPDSDGDSTPSKKKATPKSRTVKQEAPGKDVKDEFPDDAEDFIKSERAWEQDFV